MAVTKVCKKSGCGRTAIPGKDYCQKHIALQDSQEKRRVFTRRSNSNQWHYLYESARWRRESKEFLKKYPCCFICGKPSKITDHIIPHRGDVTLFWDQSNWQPMCWSCHSRKTFKENQNFNRQKGDRG